MAGICLGMQPGSKAYTSILEMNCVVRHHFILYCEFWFEVKNRNSLVNVAMISYSVLEAAFAVIQESV